MKASFRLLTCFLFLVFLAPAQEPTAKKIEGNVIHITAKTIAPSDILDCALKSLAGNKAPLNGSMAYFFKDISEATEFITTNRATFDTTLPIYFYQPNQPGTAYLTHYTINAVSKTFSRTKVD